MQTNTNKSMRDMAFASLLISIGLVALHLYYMGYLIFDRFGWTTRLTDRLLFQFSKTGWLDGTQSRMAVFFFLAVSVAAGSVRRTRAARGLKVIVLLSGGAAFFWGGRLLPGWAGDPETGFWEYAAAILMGYWLLERGMSECRLFVEQWLGKRLGFGQSNEGFPQETRIMKGEFSLHLPALYKLQGVVISSWVNFINPRRGILIVGSPGSGKSRFIIEPLIRQVVEQGQALFVYDFKYPALTRQVYGHFLANRSKYPATAGFYSIQFNDLSRSHRCNVLEPSTLKSVSDALGVARTILLSMNKTWIQRQGEFFVESPINFLAALIWWLRKYNKGCYCTLPHAIELAQTPYERLFPLLNTQPEIATLVQPFVQAWQNKTFEMLDSQISSARIPLGRLATDDVYYVLSGNDLSLQINDPAAPKVLCLGGNPRRQEALGPVLSLYIDRLNQLCNEAERRPCAIVCDEFATVRAYSMYTTIGTGRAHYITPIIAVQDLSQLRTLYTRDEADLFLNISGNLLCGQVSGETARWVSERFPRIQREKESMIVGEQGTSVSTTLQWEPTATQSTIAGLSSGEFVGVLADDPDKQMELKFFHGHLVREESGAERRIDLPMVRKVDGEDVKQNFWKIKNDINEVVTEVCEQLQGGRVVG
jgi:hypothetical protein